MSKWAKFAEKLRSGNSDNNIDFDTLLAYLEHLGCVRCGGTGSHRLYDHELCEGAVNVQVGRSGKAKSYQVEQIRKFLDTYEGDEKNAWLEGRS